MRRRGVIQNSALAFCGDIATKAATFAFLAVAAHALTVAQFALLASAVATATVLTAALDMGSQVLLSRDGTGGARARGELLRALFKARVPLLLGALLVGAAVGISAGHFWLAIATVLLASMGAAQQTLSGVLRATQNLAPEAIAKLLNAATIALCAAVCVLAQPAVFVVVISLAGATLLSLVPLVAPTRAAADLGGPRRAAWPTLRSAAPLGLMALATLAYYRSGTIVLSLTSTPRQTALYATASAIAFGLLSLSNAVTTGLLPRLAAARAGEPGPLTARALRWTVVVAALSALAVCALARPLLAVAFGKPYAAAVTPLVLLVGASVLIGASGILGTALIAAGRVRPVALQVAVTLAVNIGLLALLAPRWGASGAALATVGCEAVGLLMLLRAAWSQLPGVFDLRWRMPLRRLLLSGASR